MDEGSPPDGGGSSFQPARRLPDAALCRVRKSFGEYYDCLVSDPGSCRYALSYGSSFFCLSPLVRAKAAAKDSPSSGSGKVT